MSRGRSPSRPGYMQVPMSLGQTCQRRTTSFARGVHPGAHSLPLTAPRTLKSEQSLIVIHSSQSLCLCFWHFAKCRLSKLILHIILIAETGIYLKKNLVSKISIYNCSYLAQGCHLVEHTEYIYVVKVQVVVARVAGEPLVV